MEVEIRKDLLIRGIILALLPIVLFVLVYAVSMLAPGSGSYGVLAWIPVSVLLVLWAANYLIRSWDGKRDRLSAVAGAALVLSVLTTLGIILMVVLVSSGP